eukprot:gene10686-14349_t
MEETKERRSIEDQVVGKTVFALNTPLNASYDKTEESLPTSLPTSPKTSNSPIAVDEKKSAFTIQGWVEKKSENLGQWRHRYAFLKEMKLYFANTPFAPPHIIIDLSTCVSVKEINYAFALKIPNALEVKTVNTTVTFCVDKQDAIKLWVDAINSIIKRSQASVAFYNAIMASNFDCANSLLEENDVSLLNFKMPVIERNALLSAVEQGLTEAVRYLVDKKTDLEVEDQYGCTALFNATAAGKFELVKYLVEGGAKLNKVFGELKCTSLYVAVDYGYLDIVQLLVESGANINKPDVDGLIPAFIAMFNGDDAILKALLTPNLLVNARDLEGKTLIYHAVAINNIEIAKILVKLGADVHKLPKNTSTTLMEIALKKKYNDMVVLLKPSYVEEEA